MDNSICPKTISLSNPDLTIKQRKKLLKSTISEIDRQRASILAEIAAIDKAEELQKLEQKKHAPHEQPISNKRAKHAPISDKDRRTIENAIKLSTVKPLTIDEIAAICEVSDRTVSRVKQDMLERLKCEEEGKPYTNPVKPITGRPSKFSKCPDALIHMFYLVEMNPIITASDIIHELTSLYPELGPISDQVIYRTLKKCLYTYKKVHVIPRSWNSQETITKRSEYSRRDWDSRFVYFLDEQHYDRVKIGRQFGWSVAACHKDEKTTPTRGHVSLLMIIDRQSVACHRIFPCNTAGVSSTVFQKFLEGAIGTLRTPCVVLLDNARVHHSTKLDSFIASLRKQHNIDIQYLPPYSPFLNPAENTFHLIKENVTTLTSEQGLEMEQAIHRAVSNVTPNQLDEHFAQSEQYRTLCARGLPFTGTLLEPKIEELPEPTTYHIYDSSTEDEASTASPPR